MIKLFSNVHTEHSLSYKVCFCVNEPHVDQVMRFKAIVGPVIMAHRVVCFTALRLLTTYRNCRQKPKITRVRH